MKDYIMEVHGFKEENIIVLMDDGEHPEPTKDNILGAYEDLVEMSEAGDAVFCHYSGKSYRRFFWRYFDPQKTQVDLFLGHGGKLKDQDGDEADGYGKYRILSILGYCETMRTHTKCLLKMKHSFHWTMRGLVKFVTTIFSIAWWHQWRRMYM